MAADTSGQVQFSIGRVIGDSIGIYARNFASFSCLALLMGLIGLLMSMYNLSQTPLDESGEINFSAAQSGFLAALATLLVYFLTQAAIIYGTSQDLRGSKASFTECITRGLAAVVPVVVGSFLLMIGVSIGFLFFIIPGIIFSLMWWVYVPAIVVEGKGIFESFGRSRELTRGRRWSIFGLVIIVVVLTVVVSSIAHLLAALVASASSDPTFFFIIAEYVINAIATAFGAVLVAVGYYYLRVEKEGVDVGQLASVFD